MNLRFLKVIGGLKIITLEMPFIILVSTIHSKNHTDLATSFSTLYRNFSQVYTQNLFIFEI